MRSSFPTIMVTDFIKTASAVAMRPYSGGDGRRAQQGYNRTRQTYSQPSPQTDQTQPGTVDTQKMLQPPSV